MNRKYRIGAAILPLLVFAAPVWADDVRLAMEAANAQFLAAFNTPNPAGFPSLYAGDSILLFQGAPAMTGAEAIRQFSESRIKARAKGHPFESIETGVNGKFALQVTQSS